MDKVTPITRRMFTQMPDHHYCKSGKQPNKWRPLELVTALYPDTIALLDGLAPAHVSYCPICKELWIFVIKE